MDINYASQLDLLRQAATFIQERVPDAKAFKLQTSDQSTYGFVLHDVILKSGSHLSDVDLGLLTKLADDEVWMFLCNLDWDGVVGEDAGGYASLPANPYQLPIDAARTFVTVYMTPRPPFAPPGAHLDGANLLRALVRVRKALQALPGMLEVTKTRERPWFQVQLLEPRRDPLVIARDVRSTVAGALREMAPYTAVKVVVRRTGTGRDRYHTQDLLANESGSPISVTLGGW